MVEENGEKKRRSEDREEKEIREDGGIERKRRGLGERKNER